MFDADVIVAGLGPTGAVLAGLLAQRGLRVAAFDKLPDLFPLPRAIGFDHEVMRVMQELRIADRVCRHSAPYRPSEYLGVEGPLIKRLDSAPAPHRLGWAPNHVFDQPAFEREIRQRLTELELAQVHYSAEIQDSGEGDGHVWADVRLAGGDVTRFTAKYLVACDGGASPIRKKLGIKLEDLGFDEPWLVVDAIVPDAKLADLPQTQVQYCEPERPCTFVVGPGNHRRWEVMLLPGDSLSANFPDEELWPLLARWVKPGEVKLWRAAAYRFHGLVAERWRSGRVLLAGDSAHMTPPFMAQGMVQGIRDAQNLAWKLRRVIKGESSDALLDTYGKERRPHVRATTAASIALGRVICERDPQRARERDARLLEEHGGSIRTTIRQNMIPDLTGDLVAEDTSGAGTLFPQPLIRARGAEPVLLDEVTGPCVRVACAGPLAPEDAAALMAALPAGGRLIVLEDDDADPPGEVVAVREEGPVIGPWLAQLGAMIAVVRPDHYVFGTAGDVQGALRLLARLRERLAPTP
ncbi:bifunctional 3-(3-hydroxy-phenyl)propionate/3-hydroxycinnamic acid hydroxylase [Ideonella azotifigens]|uniref:Bifunctional 3-(3-hydroxy-phenyl)propionate/3-hydroxycinnamic acid hydroxylase n=1 Tax=Ideonella azotifigens TaxID=513160 RepID=A0ABP3VJR1_9BURK|nr:bifunctional 3-(3-hydroxy-phenyl)propionate/3-hydroxycinnamic acid hydroxylase [Ideonella azotifigens]MCD2341180.1 bifunctional 3-(3-hydroxy-phenyl)propionate/3-hydroxycinnamic acid hydroxylase [Ideonella azotifigens]